MGLEDYVADQADQSGSVEREAARTRVRTVSEFACHLHDAGAGDRVDPLAPLSAWDTVMVEYPAAPATSRMPIRCDPAVTTTLSINRSDCQFCETWRVCPRTGHGDRGDAGGRTPDGGQFLGPQALLGDDVDDQVAEQ